MAIVDEGSLREEHIKGRNLIVGDVEDAYRRALMHGGKNVHNAGGVQKELLIENFHFRDVNIRDHVLIYLTRKASRKANHFHWAVDHMAPR